MRSRTRRKRARSLRRASAGLLVTSEMLPRPCEGSQRLRRLPAESRTENGCKVGEDLYVVLVVKAERKGEGHLIDLAEGSVGVQPFGDLGRAADDVLGEHHAGRPLRARRPRSALCRVLKVFLA